MSTADRLAALKTRSNDAAREAREAQAAENRRLMPTVSQWVDEMREVFGDVSVSYASEGGRTIGKKSEDGVKLSETCAHGRVEKKLEKSVDTIHQSDIIRPVPQRNHRRTK